MTYQANSAYIAAYFGVLLIMFLMSGCNRYDPYNPVALRTSDYNPSAPVIEAAKVSCYFEPQINDNVWHFGAFISYPRLDFTKIDVAYVEIYHQEYLVNWFMLYHEKGKYWDTMRGEKSQTYLLCDYFEDYEVDFYAFDKRNNYDVMTVSGVNNF